jgi:hypothetical protein
VLVGLGRRHRLHACQVLDERPDPRACSGETKKNGTPRKRKKGDELGKLAVVNGEVARAGVLDFLVRLRGS